MITVVCYSVFILLLMFLIIEDFRYRAVRWWIFPLLGLTAVGIEFKDLLLSSLLVNACFVFIQLVALSMYFSIKERKMVNITLNYLGWGDVLFWLVICLLFAPLNFIAFFGTSLLFTALSVLVWKGTKNKLTNATIPLAGIQALALLIIVIATLYFDKFSFRDERWIEKILLTV